MSTKQSHDDAVLDRMKANRGEAWTTPEAARSRWGDKAQQKRLTVYEQSERAAKLAELAKILARAKSDLYSLASANDWLDSIGHPFPAEDAVAIKDTARVVERLLGSM